MTGKCSEVPVNERRQAVLSSLRREEPAAVIARCYGVAEATLYRWRDDFLAAGEAALAGGTQNGSSVRDRQVAELERQIESRDQVIGELTVANRVLKGPRTSAMHLNGVLRVNCAERLHYPSRRRIV